MKQLLLWTVLLFAAWKGYAHFADRPVQRAVAADGPEVAEPAQRDARMRPSPSFECDGRTHCSQMASRAEAEFFVRHCPNVKMDGDRDGEPCENDSRF